jgi:hypothetical protein
MACCCSAQNATCEMCRCDPPTAPYEWGLSFSLSATDVCFTSFQAGRGYYGYKDSVNESISVTLLGGNSPDFCNIASVSALNLPGNSRITAQAYIQTSGTQCRLFASINLQLRRILSWTCPDGSFTTTRTFLAFMDASAEIVYPPFPCAGSSFAVPMTSSIFPQIEPTALAEDFVCPPFTVFNNIWGFTNPCIAVPVSFTATITT